MSARKRTQPRPATGSAEARSGAIGSGRLRLVQLLLLVALGCSAYLAYLSLTGGQAVGCGPDSGCDKVLSSRWARWLGVPVSFFAVLTDGVFLVATSRLGRGVAVSAQRTAWALVYPCALLVAGAAVWFIVLQLAVLKSICPYCMTAHGCGLVASLLAIFSAPRRPGQLKPWELDTTIFLAPSMFRRGLLLAGLGLTALVAGQVLHEPQTFVVQRLPQTSSATNPPTGSNIPPAPAVTRIGSNDPAAAVQTNAGLATASPVETTRPTNGQSASMPTATPPGPRRLFPVYQGRFQLNLADLPLIGAATNEQVMVALHDYTCHHCRTMHPVVMEAQNTFSNQLVVVTLPMPFEPSCNPLMQRPNPNHTNACLYAQLGLAVFRADRSKHHAYEDYLFTGEKPPPIDAARRVAVELVGEDALVTALNDPWVDQHIKLGVALYAVAYQARQGSMPQFIVGERLAVGTIPRDQFMDLLIQGLHLVPPAPDHGPAVTPAPPPAAPTRPIP